MVTSTRAMLRPSYVSVDLLFYYNKSNLRRFEARCMYNDVTESFVQL